MVILFYGSIYLIIYYSQGARGWPFCQVSHLSCSLSTELFGRIEFCSNFASLFIYEPIFVATYYMLEHLTITKEKKMPKMSKWRRPDALTKLLWTLIERDKAVLFVEKMKVTPSTFYRWLNGTRYPCLENVRRINRAMRTKQFLGFDHDVLPQ